MNKDLLALINRIQSEAPKIQDALTKLRYHIAHVPEYKDSYVISFFTKREAEIEEFISDWEAGNINVLTGNYVIEAEQITGDELTHGTPS